MDFYSDLWDSINDSDNVSPSLRDYSSSPSLAPSSGKLFNTPTRFDFDSSYPASTVNNYYNYSYPNPYNEDYYRNEAENRRSAERQSQELAAANRYAASLQYQGVVRANEINKEINQANIDYQKAENELARAREDSAVQRRVADLKQAGLSSTLAAGNPASAQQMTAPRSEMYYQNPYAHLMEYVSNKIAIAHEVAQVRYLDSLSNLNNIDAQTRASQNMANLRYSESRAHLEELSAKYSAETIDARIRQINLSNLKTEEDIELVARQIVEQDIQNNILSYQDKMKGVTYWVDTIGKAAAAAGNFVPGVHYNYNENTSYYQRL